MRRHIPNILTLGNLSCGVLAILSVFNTGRYADMETTFRLLLAALVLDFLDGFAARRLNVRSELGKQLDSLADMVSFGVLPGVLAIQYLLFRYWLGDYPLLSGRSLFDYPYWQAVLVVQFIAGMSIPVCSAIRLARFNLDRSGRKGFLGLPTPALAFWVVSLVFALDGAYAERMAEGGGVPWYLYVHACGAALMGPYLLLAPVPMIDLKFEGSAWRINAARFVFLGSCALLPLIAGKTWYTYVVPSYILVSTVAWLWEEDGSETV